MNSMLTLEEVKNYLELEQEELEKYIHQGKLNAYKIGGAYLRFRKEDVLNLQHEIAPSFKKKKNNANLFTRIFDFWLFNNFYILSIILVAVVAYFVIKGQ